jgi:hypothetical protein
MGFVTAALLGGAALGGMFAGRKAASKGKGSTGGLMQNAKDRVTQRAAEARGSATAGVPAPPPTASESTSSAVAQARQASIRRRRRASGGAVRTPGSVGGRSILAVNTSQPRSLIGG